MRVITLTQQYDLQWDQYVKKHAEASPYHLLAYKHTLESAYKLTCPYLLAIDNSKIVGVLPIAIFKTILGKQSYCSLPYCDVGGALTDSAEITKELLATAKTRMTDDNINEWQIRDSESLNTVCDAKVSPGTKVRMILNLPSTVDELWNNFKAKVRSQIRKAEKNNLTHEINQEHSLTDFYRVYCQNMKALGSPVHTLSWFKSIKQHYQNDIHIVVIKLDEQAIAASIMINSGQLCSVPWASSLREFNSSNANMLLYFKMLSLAVEKRSSHFDFGRSSFAENTYKFKKQWGAQACALQWHTHPQTTMTNPTTSHSKLRTLLAKVWSFLPLTLTNYIGAKVRRYISL